MPRLAQTEPSPRQVQILQAILGLTKRKGYPPTMREIGDAVGLRSPSTVYAHLTRLRELGYVAYELTKPRSLRVLVQPEGVQV